MLLNIGADSSHRNRESSLSRANLHSSRLVSVGLLWILVLSTGPMTAEPQPQLLPHHAELVPGVHAAGFSHQFASANCGWVELDGETLLVDLPRGRSVEAYLDRVTAQGKRPARRLVLTHIWEDPSWATYSAYEPVEKRWYRSPEPMGPDPVAPLVGALVKGGRQTDRHLSQDSQAAVGQDAGSGSLHGDGPFESGLRGRSRAVHPVPASRRGLG